MTPSPAIGLAFEQLRVQGRPLTGLRGGVTVAVHGRGVKAAALQLPFSVTVPDSGFVQHASSPRVPGFNFLTAAKMRHEPSLVAQDRIGEPTVRAPLHGGFRGRPTVPLLPAVAMIVRGGHSGDVQERTPLQRLVDTMLDRAEATSPTVKYDIWMPSLESLLLPRDPPESPRAALPVVHRYRSHTVQPFDTAALTVWVSPAGGVTAPPGASSYSGDPITERITDH